MELLCIKTHSKKVVVAGNPYPLIKTATCPCGYKSVDVGIRCNNPPKMKCAGCGRETTIDIWWIGAHLFAQIGEEDSEADKNYKKEEIKV